MWHVIYNIYGCVVFAQEKLLEEIDHNNLPDVGVAFVLTVHGTQLRALALICWHVSRLFYFSLFDT